MQSGQHHTMLQSPGACFLWVLLSAEAQTLHETILIASQFLIQTLE